MVKIQNITDFADSLNAHAQASDGFSSRAYSSASHLGFVLIPRSASEIRAWNVLSKSANSYWGSIKAVRSWNSLFMLEIRLISFLFWLSGTRPAPSRLFAPLPQWFDYRATSKRWRTNQQTSFERCDTIAAFEGRKQRRQSLEAYSFLCWIWWASVHVDCL